MSKLDMQDFLTEMHECCDRLSEACSYRDVDPEPLKKLKENFREFVLSHKDTILSFYDFAKTKGKFSITKSLDLLTALCKYEEFHDDMYVFIRSIMQTQNKSEEEIIEHIHEAIKTDERFRKSLFSEPTLIPFHEALSNLDVVMGVCTFIDKAFDNFIYLRGVNDESSIRVKCIIDLYCDSVTRFIRTLIDCFASEIEEMNAVMNGKLYTTKSEQVVDNSFKLI